MLREQVWQAWTSYKEKIISWQKAINFLAEENALPAFPLGLAANRRNLDHWTSFDYCQKLDQSKQKSYAAIPDNSSDAIVFLQSHYTSSLAMFKELTHGWKKEIADNSSSGPIIEEVY